MLHVSKNFKKAAAYLVILTSLLSGAVFVYAQFSDSSYLVKTVHIFPSNIEAPGWDNAATLSFQNLDEYALLQEFNKINSATLNLNPGTLLEKAETQTTVESGADDGAEQSAAQPDTEPATTSQPQTESATDDVATTSDATTTAPVEFDFVEPTEPASDEQNPDTAVTTSTESGTDDTQPAPADEPAAAAQEKATTTVMNRAQSVFRLAMTAVTSAFDTATNTPDQSPVEESNESDVANETTAAESAADGETSAPTTSADDVAVESPETDATPTVVPETVVDTGTAATDTDPTTETDTVVDTDTATEAETDEFDNQAAENTPSPENQNLDTAADKDEQENTAACTEDCKPYVITLSDFGFPLDDTTEVTGAQLRMSFAAQKKSYRERIPAFEMRYSMDSGATWASGGAVVIDDEVSNGYNGGYFLFALPELSSEAELESLQVELSYRDDPSVLKGLFVESVWLELFTLEASGEQSPNDNLASALLEDGFNTEQLSGDNLLLPDGKTVAIDNTDENDNETLIIKSDKADYVGLTKTTSYFSVTNTSNRADDFTLQTYFSKSSGQVKSIREYNQNTPKEVTVPEYRPFVYNCEAGWDYVGEVEAGSLEELSQQFVNQQKKATTTVEQTTAESTEATTASTSDTDTDTAATPADSSEQDTDTATTTVEFDFSLPNATKTEPVAPTVLPASNTTTTVFHRLPSVQQLLQSSTTTVPSATATEVAAEAEENTDAEDQEEMVNSYACRNTNVVRTCDSIDGDNTACRVESMKVAEHKVTKYVPGWASTTVATGTMPKGSIFKRVAQFVGFGPDKKQTGESFEVQSHTPNKYKIQPGETKYFEMEISFPPFSSGEYWIEAIGDREYGLLDPFWSSLWRYKKPITIDNLNGPAVTEQQIFLEMDATETDFWSNVKADGGDIRFVAEGEDSGAWYDGDWSQRLALVIDATNIDATLTDFPVYVDLADFDTSFFSSVKADGGDIRVTTADGTEVPREVVAIDTGTETGELYFKASSLSSTTDNTFYIYYSNGLASDYATSSTYGGNNVWSSTYRFVSHDGGITNATGKTGVGNTSAGGYSVVTDGKFGDAVHFDGSGGIVHADDTELDFDSDMEMMFWGRTTGNKPGREMIEKQSGNFYQVRGAGVGSDAYRVQFDSGPQSTVTSDTGLADGGWHQLHFQRESGVKANAYTNGVYTQSSVSDPGGSMANNGTLQFGNNYASPGQGWIGDVDEIRFKDTLSSAEWIKAEHTNQNDSATFYSLSAAEDFVAGVSFTELDYWIQHFDYDKQEADIWVQTDELPAAATSTIHMYYGNALAETTSDEYAPFTYSSSTDLYYVVSDKTSSPLVVYSYVDNNEVAIDGGAPVALQAGETTSFDSYSASSVISTLGPVSALSSQSKSDALVPISFATTTNLVTSERGAENFHVLSPFSSADVEVFKGDDVTPSASGSILPKQATKYSVALSGTYGVLESDEPTLLFYEGGSRDSYAAYPPTLRDIYGIHSTQYNYTSVSDGTAIDIYCSGGASTTVSGVGRGSLQRSDACTADTYGTGDAVRLANQTAPIAASQEADGGGSEATRFLPTPEFATEYIFAQDAEYVAIACAPRFGEVEIEIQDTLGDMVASGTCTPDDELPGALNFNDAGVYAQGYKVVATNNVPFYAYFERNVGSEEVNVWGAVQGKKFNSLYTPYTIGAEEENEDAQYEQNNFAWYENADSLSPGNRWSLDGGDLAQEGDAIGTGVAINPGDVLRLRMNLLANNGTGTVDSTAFTLQYASAETCSAVTGSSWSDVAAVGSTTAAFAGYNNASAIDGDTLSGALLSDTDVLASYEEENISSTLPNEVANGSTVEFDWVITPVQPVANTEYCFRMIRSIGVPIATYSSYPQLLTSGPPEATILQRPFDNEHATSTSPEITFTAADRGGDDLDYEIEIATDKDFSSIVVNRDSGSNPFDFENVLLPSDKAPFNNGQTIQFLLPSALTNGDTYWWRVRAIDPAGSNTYGAYSKAQSFTINTGVIVSEWFQTTDDQFLTNSLSGATTTGNGAVVLDLGGSNLVGEYGTVSLTSGATTSVSLNHSYTNPVVVASVRYSRSISSPNNTTARIFNKSATGFDVYTDNYLRNAVGTSTVDYMVVEAGDYLIDNGADGLRMFATSTSVSAYAGQSIPANPGGPTITFPTSFGSPPVVLSALTTINDPDWAVSTVYDGNNRTNPPTATQVGVFINDQAASNGHMAAEDIDIIAFDKGYGSNNSVDFDIGNTGAVVTHAPSTYTFGNTFSSAPAVTLVSQLTTKGSQGSNALVDLDTPTSATDVTVSVDEGGNADRAHAAEDIGVVAFANSSGSIIRAGKAQMVSAPIDFDDGVIGNAWGEMAWDSEGDVTVRLQYNDGSGFVNVPDTQLSGNAAGFTTSPVNILSLDTSVYNELRLVTNLTGIDPKLLDWTVSWGQRVEIPELGDPFDNEKTAATTPVFDFITIDPQGDSLVYELSYSTDPAFSTGSTTVRSDVSGDFVNQNNPGNSNPFNSGETIAYTVPGGSALTDGETYWWRVRAKDPDGANVFSPWSEADNFTVDTSTVVSSWFQTTRAQFQQGVIDGVIASSSGSIMVSDEVGEYGTTTVTGNAWRTVYTDINYDNMVVVASPEYGFNGSDNGRSVQVRNKTRNSFEVKAENYTKSLSGSDVTKINYIVIEAGDWLLSDGGSGLRVVAGTETEVSTVNGSNIGYTSGRKVDLGSPFASTPAGIATVSSDNGAKWVHARIDDGTVDGEVTATDFYLSLGTSLDIDTTRAPEDIDYLAFTVGAGSNGGSLFDAFNSSDNVTHNNTSVSFNQTFSTAPGVILVQNNGMDGAQGGTAQVDTDILTSAGSFNASVAEHGASADSHTSEIISVLAFENNGGKIFRDGTGGSGLSGTIASEPILFSDGLGPKFDRALFTDISPSNSTTTLQIEYQTATGSWALLPDTEVAGNSNGLTSSPVDLTNVDVQSYPVIRLRATLICDTGQCPVMDDWTVEWSEGVALTGNLKGSDRSVNVSGTTIAAAVNGTPAGQTTTTDSNGDFTLGNVTAFDGDTVTVYASGVADTKKANGVFVYDGLGDMTGVQLYEQHLTLTSEETATNTIATLAVSDNSSTDNDDVFFNVSYGGDLSVCAVSGCESASLYVGANNIFVPDATASKKITTHDFVNDGSVQLGNNKVFVSGSWENNGQLQEETSTVTFVGSEGGWYDDAWDHRTPVTIDSSAISSTLSNFPVYLKLADLPTEFFAGVKADGSDIRITEADGISEVPFELVRINTNGNTGELHFKAPRLSDTQDTTFYVYYGNAAAAAYSVSDTYGRNNVWSDYEAVWHLNDTNFTDSTGNPRTPTNVGVTASTINDRPVAYFNGNSYLDFGNDINMGLGDLSISLYVQTTDNDAAYLAKSYYSAQDKRYALFHSGADLKSLFDGGSNNANTEFNGTFTDNTFKQAAVTYDRDGNNSLYSEGILRETTGIAAYSQVDFNDTNHLFMGTYNDVTGNGAQPDLNFTGKMAEVKISRQVLSPDWLAAENTNQTNSSSFYYIGSNNGWYDEDWGRRLPITVKSSALSSTQYNFPVYVDLADLPADFFADVKASGGDIRVTEGSGRTEIPFELVSIDTATKKGQLHFKAPRLTSTQDTVFYIYYDNPAATAYAATDLFGRNNVWSDYEAVWHFNDTNFTDSTGNPRTPTNVGVTATTTANGRAAAYFDGSSYLDFGNDVNMGLDDLSFSLYVETTDTDASYLAKSYRSGQDKRYGLYYIGGELTTLFDGGTVYTNSTYSGTFVDGALRQAAATFDRSGDNTLYSDGIRRQYKSISTYSGVDFNDTNRLYIGTYNDSTGHAHYPDLNYTGKMMEVKMSRQVLTPDWLAAENINQTNQANFYAVGSIGAAPTTTIPVHNNEYLSGNLNFYDLNFSDAGENTTWETLNDVVVKDDLQVVLGRLNRATSSINVAGDIRTGTQGYWSGLGTTTFDGSGTAAWTDVNPVSQNIGRVVIDGDVRTVMVGSNVSAQSIFIGANDTLNGGGANDIKISGNFTNTNVFVPGTAQLVALGTTTTSLITTNGSNIYKFRASSTAGAVSFTEPTVTILDDFAIATGTVTLPTDVLKVGGSFVNTGGNFAHNNGEVRFTSVGTETVQLQGTSFLNAFYDVRFNGTGNWSFLDTNATTSNQFTIDNGTVTLPSGQLSVARDFKTNAPGSFVANGGEVLLSTRSNDAITTSGSEFYDVRIVPGAILRGGDFDQQWLGRGVITIKPDAINADLTDFPVYVDLADFDSGFFSRINTDGGDIRITQSDGLTEVPREIVDIDTSAQTGELYFKAPTLSSTTNSTFYIYYDNSAATDYAASDTYGRNNVWPDTYRFVSHDGGIVNSTGKTSDGAAYAGGYTVIDGKVGGSATQFDGTGGISHSDDDELDFVSDMELAFWGRTTGSGAGIEVFEKQAGNFYQVRGAGGGGSGAYYAQFDSGPQSSVYSAAGVGDGNWHQMVFQRDDGVDVHAYTNGVFVGSNGSDPGGSMANGGSLLISKTGWLGDLDEIRFKDTLSSAAWIKAEHINQASSSDFYTIVSGSSVPTRIFADSNTTIENDLVIDNAQTQFPGGTLSIGGSLDNNGVFLAGNGSVRFNANNTGKTVAAGSSSFFDLDFVGAGGGWTVSENATATNALTLSAGNDFTVASGVTLESTGTFFNDLTSASTTWSGSTLRLTGGGGFAINNKTNAGDQYDTLSLATTTAARMWNSSASTYLTADTSSLYSQDHATVDGDLYIFGDYSRATGTEYWSYATDFDGADLVALSSERSVNVRVADTGSVTIASSTLSVLGDATASTTIDAQAGSFAMDMSNATLTAQHFTMAGTDVAGLNLLASTTVTTFGDFVFSIPAGASAITVDAATVDTNPASHFFNTDFVSSGGDTNVTLLGTPTSYWWFRDGAGDRYGEAFDSNDTDPGSIRWDDSSYNINISGTVYSDDGATTMGASTCDGTTPNVRVVVSGGTYTDAVSCSAADGTYNFANVSYVGDPSIIVYLDTAGGEQGSVVTRTPTADIVDLDIYANRVSTRHEDVAPLTIANMAWYDGTDDSDIAFTVATGTTDTLTVSPDTELYVMSGKNFQPNGEIILLSSGSGAIYDGSLHLGDSASFTATGAETYRIGGSFFNNASSTFTPASSTVLFTATTSGKGITQISDDVLHFNEVQFTGVGGAWNITADIALASDMTISTGTVTGTGDITMQTGQLAGAGLLSLGGGTTTINKSTELGGVQSWTFYDLVLGDGATTSTTTRTASAPTKVANQLVIAPGHYLDAGASVWNLAGTGEVFVEQGTLLQGNSTFVYSGAGAVDVVATNYYNLSFGGAAGTPVYTLPPLGVLIENDLQVGGSVASVVDIDTNDPVVAVQGDVNISDQGVLSLSDSAELTISGSYSNTATLNANKGTMVFDGATAYTIAAGNSPLANVSLLGSGAVTVTQNATATGQFLIATSSDFTLQSGSSLAVGGQLRVQSPDTLWTGTSLNLFGGGDYTVNEKDLSLTLGDLSVAANTQIRTWNTQVSGQTVAASGSWYSQDHAGVVGDLYVFGDYIESSRADHWSYATDFDGADLTGSERPVAVYIAEDATAQWNGGSISVLGTPTATTTIDNQGSGTYGLVIGGNSTADWQYLSVRNINDAGLTFAGSPTVSNFANADLLVQRNGASAMTVGGSAITASPARTLSDVVFNYGAGVTGAVNVTATGTTLSGWRFTAHSGNLAGESNDVDPGGDPGYIIWDDSAAIISLSGTVYEADRSTVSSVCDDSTTNIVLAIKGSLVQNASSSCSATDGSYLISGVSFGSLDELTLYIDGEAAQGVMVTKDPISSIGDADIYENHVIVRHESNVPLDIANMAVWDSSDDADIPFTATAGGTNSLSLPSNTKLLIWGAKDFAPQGNITLNGGGAGASYDGSLEALANASFIATGNETHQIGGSFEFAGSADFVAASSTIVFTSDDAVRNITVNGAAFHDASFTGSGDWTITDATTVVQNNLSIDSGALELSSGTTTIAGSLLNNGTLDTNDGLLNFAAQSGAHTVKFNGYDAADVLFAGAASWTLADTNATATAAFIVATGSVALPSGTLAVGQDFVVLDTITHNSGQLLLSNPTGETTLTLSANDLYSVQQTGAATTTMTDASAALLGDLLVLDGTFVVATNTLAIGGSLEASAAVLETATGTILFNSDNAGEFVDIGDNVFYNAVFANSAGGWSVFGATSTNNFVISTASSFTLASGESLTVGGVFQNLVGGAATTWTDTVLRLDGSNAYSVNNKNTAGDNYETLLIGGDSDIRLWNSAAAITAVASSSSLYSQDHADTAGALYVYGDMNISTSTEYWSYAKDFDGTDLAGLAQRQVNVFQAENSTTTVAAGGTLQMVGEVGFPTTVQNQGVGHYAMNITGGQINFNHYIFSDLNKLGLNISGSPVISDLSFGEYNVGIEDGSAITLEQLALNSNPSLLITGTKFELISPLYDGTNVNLSATSTNSWTFRNETGNIAGEWFDNDGVTECGSIRWSDSSCLLTEQTAYRWRNDDGGIGAPDSEWFDTDWSKRKRIRVANNDNTAYASTTVKILVEYDPDMQSDFEDLRFTQADGVTPVNFWVEKYSTGVSADVWLEVPVLAAKDTTAIHMYYDNGSAGSQSSAVDTMIAADDFEDGDVAEYSGQPGLFQAAAGSAYAGSYGLELKPANKGTRLNPGIARFDQVVGTGQTIRFMQYIDTVAGASDEVCTLFAVQSPASLNQNYGVCLEQFGVDRVTLAKNVLSTDNYGAVSKLASSTVTYTTGWHEVEVDWLTDNTINVSVYNPSGSLVATTSATDATYTSGGIGFTSWGQNGGWDSYTARTYMQSKPTIFFGAEQVGGGASYAALQNQVTSAFNPGDTARLRLAIENTGLDIFAQEYTLEYAEKSAAPSCAAVSGSVYQTVPLTAACGNSAVCMSSSATVANGAATSDMLSVQRNTYSAGAFVEDPSNRTAPKDLQQNFYTELEYAISITPNATDQSYCFRVTDGGVAYDSYVNVPELELSFDPVVGAISLNGGADISLIPGTTTAVYATGTVTDFNGAADLTHASATIYRSGVTGGAACTPDNNNCYVASTGAGCEFTSCSGSSCEVQCRADIFFHADPTDIGQYDGQEWQAFIEVEDFSGGYDFASAIGVELTTLRAIDVTGAIDYGALAVNDDTGSYNASTSVMNLGNVEVNIDVEGSDLTDGHGSFIPAEQQKFSTTTFNYSACGSACSLLSSSAPVELDIGLAKPVIDTPPIADDVYWGIAIPFGVNSVPHQGINVFTPVSP